MFDTVTESLASTQVRPVQSRALGRVIAISDHVPQTPQSPQSARVTACAAPFLACRNSIMQGADGVPRCNSPFLHCKRYVYTGDAGDAASSFATKNRRESIIGSK